VLCSCQVLLLADAGHFVQLSVDHHLGSSFVTDESVSLVIVYRRWRHLSSAYDGDGKVTTSIAYAGAWPAVDGSG
jgi:hypothetical protein